MLELKKGDDILAVVGGIHNKQEPVLKPINSGHVNTLLKKVRKKLSQ